MLTAKNLAFSYDNAKPVLDGFSLSLKAGEVVSLLGPSGCGKSTVLRIVSGLLDAEQGRVEWHSDPDVAFVFQDPALMPWASIEQNVALPSRLSGKVDDSRVAEALAAVNLTSLEKRFPAMLSGGQRMRASVARALSANPSTLLMDEPFAALDEILRFQMNDLLLDLVAERGFGVLFVTHSLFEAAYLSDRVLVMQEGKVAGEVIPSLDRSLTPNAQRGSSAFVSAVDAMTTLLKVIEQ
ncbi:ABC transporter ATP-binding protein [Kordiimonas aquimaris]|uniref:ABC transporter ATP-binding protein n=1 Tax=Kordiimonas aquimaris TaxID=707591 RepID=UPI0021D182E4|nr:ATP-binding cassette domain-containing protein [Kordiimonas aquimaris]